MPPSLKQPNNLWTLAKRIAQRRSEINPYLYEMWLIRMGYKRVPNFWERY